MKNSKYSYTRQGTPARACDEHLVFSIEHYNDHLRQAEMDLRFNAATHPETPSMTASPALLKRLVALGQAILNL